MTVHSGETIADMVVTIVWHQKLLDMNTDVIDAEYASNDPDIEKIRMCKEEVWFHSHELKTYITRLVAVYVRDLTKI